MTFQRGFAENTECGKPVTRTYWLASRLLKEIHIMHSLSLYAPLSL